MSGLIGQLYPPASLVMLAIRDGGGQVKDAAVKVMEAKARGSAYVRFGMLRLDVLWVTGC